MTIKEEKGMKFESNQVKMVKNEKVKLT